MSASLEDAMAVAGEHMAVHLIDEIRKSSTILTMMMFPPDPWARRAHMRRHRLLWWRRVIVWDETEAEHAERIAKLGPKPAVIHYGYRRMGSDS